MKTPQEYIIEARQKMLSEEGEKWAVYMKGGAVGEKEKTHSKYGKLVKEFDDEVEAKAFAKRSNSRLSPGEKQYYKIKYTAVKI